MGLVPEPLKEKMSQYYVDEVSRFDWHPRTGFIGTPRLLPGLHLAGKDEDAYKTLLTKSAPSWLYPVSVGATTIWERWDAWDGVNPKGGMNSLNHYSFGAVGEYLYRIIGGISQDKPGYKSIRIEPIIKDGLTHATTTYRSIQGEIATAWKTEGKSLTLDVTIPANTDASVYIPTKNPNLVTESGTTMANAKGVTFMKFENNKAIYRIGSGRYHFRSIVQ
jgi:alpha-L-rhamnosidase